MYEFTNDVVPILHMAEVLRLNNKFKPNIFVFCSNFSWAELKDWIFFLYTHTNHFSQMFTHPSHITGAAYEDAD